VDFTTNLGGKFYFGVQLASVADNLSQVVNLGFNLTWLLSTIATTIRFRVGFYNQTSHADHDLFLCLQTVGMMEDWGITVAGPGGHPDVANITSLGLIQNGIVVFYIEIYDYAPGDINVSIDRLCGFLELVNVNIGQFEQYFAWA
jgi:hypothetical protein